MAKTKKETPNKVVSKTKRNTKQKTTAFLKRNWWKILIILIILAGLGLFTREYLNTKQQLKDLKSPSTSGKSDLEVVTEQVSKIAELPQGESPTLATVNDATKLNTKIFFKNTQNGDRVLIYAKAKRAVLYRPSTNKIIEITSVNFDTATKQPEAVPAQ